MSAGELQELGATAEHDTRLVQGLEAQARLRGLLAEADAAYTSAVQRAAQTGDWTLVPAAHQALHQTRGGAA